MNSNQIIQECINRTKTNVERASKTFSHLSENQLNWKPNPDSWSVGECISHLVTTNKLYINKIEKILASVSFSEEKEFPYKQSLFGKFIAKGVDPANVRKTKTFKVFYPLTSNIQKNVIDEYAESSKKFIDLTQKMLSLDLKKYKLSSPANKWIKLNLGDPLIIIPLHDERHLNQAERVMNHKDFSKG